MVLGTLFRGQRSSEELKSWLDVSRLCRQAGGFESDFKLRSFFSTPEVYKFTTSARFSKAFVYDYGHQGARVVFEVLVEPRGPRGYVRREYLVLGDSVKDFRVSHPEESREALVKRCCNPNEPVLKSIFDLRNEPLPLSQITRAAYVFHAPPSRTRVRRQSLTLSQGYISVAAAVKMLGALGYERFYVKGEQTECSILERLYGRYRRSSSDTATSAVLGFRITEETSIEEVVGCLVAQGHRDLTPMLQAVEKERPLQVHQTRASVVYKHIHPNNSDKLIAVKCISHSIERKQLKGAAREFKSCATQCHENILRPIGFGVYRGQLALVIPWMHNGDVVSYINEHPDVDRLALCTQLAAAVAYLHEDNVIHADIKGANVLISDRGTVQLTDFGLAIMARRGIIFSESSGGRGTPRWQAPEILTGNSDSSEQGDVYSLGLTMLEIVQGSYPYGDPPLNYREIGLIIEGKLRPERPNRALVSYAHADDFWELVTKCWNNDPSKRPTAFQVHERMSQLVVR